MRYCHPLWHYCKVIIHYLLYYSFPLCLKRVIDSRLLYLEFLLYLRKETDIRLQCSGNQLNSRFLHNICGSRFSINHIGLFDSIRFS